jgi:anti-anti-sigma factor
MKLTHEDTGPLSVLTLKGDFTCDHVEQFQSAVDERLGGHARDFVLNLTELDFIDSAGLESLLRLQDTCTELLGQVRLAGVTGNIEQVLRITRLAQRFERLATVEQAVKSLRV